MWQLGLPKVNFDLDVSPPPQDWGIRLATTRHILSVKLQWMMKLILYMSSTLIRDISRFPDSPPISSCLSGAPDISSEKCALSLLGNCISHPHHFSRRHKLVLQTYVISLFVPNIKIPRRGRRRQWGGKYTSGYYELSVYLSLSTDVPTCPFMFSSLLLCSFL